MLAINSHSIKPRWRHRPNQSGVAAVEFALVACVFFLIVFGIMEVVRVTYLYNTLAEVTRSAAHAAANISFKDGDALDLARKRAVFDQTNGVLPFGNPITYQNIRIEYLYLPAKTSELKPITGSMPNCPAENRANCLNDPNSMSCIRAVQASICKEGASGNTCTPVTNQPLFSLVYLPVSLPKALTIVSAETLGYKSGDNISCN
jgi:hypothetical protein